MRLTLTIVDQTESADARSPFVCTRGRTSIGRGDDNDWVLPDSARHLSKRHCVIDHEAGVYTITDLSTNGVFINHGPTALGRRNSAVLKHGDTLQFGGYRILVALEAALPSADRPPEHPVDFDLFEALGNRMPAEIGGRPTPASFGPLGGLPGDEDAPAGPLVPQLGGGPLPGRQGDEADWRGPAPWRQATVADHISEENQFYAPPDARPDTARGAAGNSGIPEDWLEEDAPPEPVPDAAPDPRPHEEPVSWEPASGQAPSGAGAMPSMPGRPQPAPASASTVSGNPAEALKIFLKGAGLGDLEIDPADAPEILELLGQTFRVFADGLRNLLMARASMKNELRIERTMIAPAHNNPLKFTVSLDDALAALVGPPRRGFMPPVAAVENGFRDVQAHQLATVGGIQVALKLLLDQLDPEAIRTTEPPGRLDALVAASRKARLWEEFERRYADLARQIDEDSGAVIGRAFALAYETSERAQGIRRERRA